MFTEDDYSCIHTSSGLVAGSIGTNPAAVWLDLINKALGAPKIEREISGSLFPQDGRCDPASLMLLSACRCAGEQAKSFPFCCLFSWSVFRVQSYLASCERYEFSCMQLRCLLGRFVFAKAFLSIDDFRQTDWIGLEENKRQLLISLTPRDECRCTNCRGSSGGCASRLYRRSPFDHLRH
jgi:hypothetical protein